MYSLTKIRKNFECPYTKAIPHKFIQNTQSLNFHTFQVIRHCKVKQHKNINNKTQYHYLEQIKKTLKGITVILVAEPQFFQRKSWDSIYTLILYNIHLILVLWTGRLSFLKDSDSRSHWNAHLLQTLFSQIWQFFYSNFLVLKNGGIFL